MDPNIWTVVSLWYRPIVAHSYKQRASAGLEHFVDGVSIKLKCSASARSKRSPSSQRGGRSNLKPVRSAYSRESAFTSCQRRSARRAGRCTSSRYADCW